MNARDVGYFPHWANRDDIGRFTPRLNSAPETSLQPQPADAPDDVDVGRDPYAVEEYEAMQDEPEEPRPFRGYAKLSEIWPFPSP